MAKQQVINPEALRLSGDIKLITSRTDWTTKSDHQIGLKDYIP